MSTQNKPAVNLTEAMKAEATKTEAPKAETSKTTEVVVGQTPAEKLAELMKAPVGKAPEAKAPEAPKTEAKLPAKAKEPKAPAKAPKAKANGLGEGIDKGDGVTWYLDLGKRFLIQVTGKDCGRGRFVGPRLHLTPWRFQGRPFEDEAKAQAFAETLQPKPGQHLKVVVWAKAWHETLPEVRWANDQKIARKGDQAKAA
jgi:hypothetical protein